MEVSAAALERAIGADSFVALQREIGALAVYSMTEQQSESVVRMQLGQLANLEQEEIFEEYLYLRDQINAWETLISDDENINVVIRADLEQIRDRFGDARKTEISDEGGSVDYADLIPETDQIVNISHNGYIKRMLTETYRVQNRGGKGVHGGAKDDDFIEHFFVASSHAYLLCFTSLGQLYWLKVYNIPEASRTSAGRSIANVLSLKPDEKITSIIPIRHFEPEASLLMATRRGLVKKTVLTAYSRPRQGGLIGIALEDGDTLIQVCLVRPTDEVILSTRNGMAIRFDESDVRQTSRDTYGVKGVTLGRGDELVGMVVAREDGQLLSVCEKGYGKRTPIGPNTQSEVVEDEPATEAGTEAASDSAILRVPVDGEEEAASDPSGMRYRKQRRGGKGVRDIKTSDRNGKVVAIQIVTGNEDVMLISRQGQITRIHASDIRLIGRNTQGVRVMNFNNNDTISSMALLAREEVPEEVPTASAIADAGATNGVPTAAAVAPAVAVAPVEEEAEDDTPF